MGWPPPRRGGTRGQGPSEGGGAWRRVRLGSGWPWARLVGREGSWLASLCLRLLLWPPHGRRNRFLCTPGRRNARTSGVRSLLGIAHPCQARGVKLNRLTRSRANGKTSWSVCGLPRAIPAPWAAHRGAASFGGPLHELRSTSGGLVHHEPPVSKHARLPCPNVLASARKARPTSSLPVCLVRLPLVQARARGKRIAPARVWRLVRCLSVHTRPRRAVDAGQPRDPRRAASACLPCVPQG